MAQIPCVVQSCTSVQPPTSAPAPPTTGGLTLPTWLVPALAVLAVILGAGAVLYLLAMGESLRAWVARRLRR